MSIECEHGSLRRQCELCERDAEIERLNAVIAEQGAQIDALQDRWANRPLDHASGEALIGENKRLEARLAETGKIYSELLYGVGSKFPGETRHQTALRYIKNAERTDNSAASVAQEDKS